MEENSKEIKTNKKERTKEKNIKTHDSMFKELLEDKEEFKDYMKDFLGYDIEEVDLELQNKEYRLREMQKTKYMDIVYKIKGEETYIIIEHQSTIDKKMAERMSENCLSIVESRNKYVEESDNRKAPEILPNVLSTVNKKWNVPTTIIQRKESRYKIPKQNYPKYIIINNYDYTIDELIEKRTGMGIGMAFEISLPQSHWL